MPQPALHLRLAEAALSRWRRLAEPPFDVRDAMAVNAFRHGSLAPDLGSFPGGDRELSRRIHARPADAPLFALLRGARSDVERAYSWGWLTHVLADAAIHPLVNAAAAARAGAVSPLIEHVRVEVGLDAWFCWQNSALGAIQLTPAPAEVHRLVRDVLAASVDCHVTLPRLRRMERGCIGFTHAALHFATRVAAGACWRDAPAAHAAPPASLLVWNIASTLSPRSSIVFAYLNPHRPDNGLLTRVEHAIRWCETELDRCVAEGPWHLPPYRLEDGVIVLADDRVA